MSRSGRRSPAESVGPLRSVVTVPGGGAAGGTQDEVGDQRGPARLVGGADATAGVAVEVLVEGQQVVPVRVGLEEVDVAEDRAAAALVVEEDRNETAGEVVGQDGQGDLASGADGVLDEDVVAEEPGIPVQRLDDQVVDREPDRAAPVGVAAEQAGGGLARLVV